MNKRLKALLIPVSLLLLFIVGFAATRNRSENTNISITESRTDITLSADFPDRKSKAVQNFLIKQFNLTDLTDLNHLEIENYETPDKAMRFYIKSREGSFRIALIKDQNDENAYKKLKETGEALKDVLKH